MNFASPYIYNNSDEEFEVVSDEEFHKGMEFSDSDGEDSEEPRQEQQTGSPPAEQAAVVPGSPERQGSDPSSSSHSSRSTIFGRVKGMLSRGGQSASHSERKSQSLPPRPARLKSDHHWKSPDPYLASGAKGKQFRRADSNIVSLRFDTLKKPSTMHAGEVIQCSGCKAIMSSISTVEEDGPDKVWKCEFCGDRNLVDIEKEEKPTADDVTYLLEAALATSSIGSSGRDESIVVFCIDISGSMTITTAVPGNQKLRGSATLRRMRRENSMEGSQRLPSEVRNVTYISRLQAVQAAVDHQLAEMVKEFPDRRVALIAFSSDVMVIGDGTGEVVTVSGQKLTNKEELMKVGSELPLPKAVKEVRASLGDKIFGLEEGGATALGPAIIIALSLASQQPGSKVILCTDGKSNEGVGKVENVQESDPPPSEFYDDIATTANSKGVSVSVITITGTDCQLIQLGRLASNTGGQVNIVDPLKLTEEFSNVLADRIIATSVVATFLVHKDLYIGKEENAACMEKREIGNVSAEHEISFEFGMRKKKSREQQPQQQPQPNPLECISEDPTSVEETSSSSNTDERAEADKGSGAEAPHGSGTCEGGASAQEEATQAPNAPAELPFQVQITYTDVDGTKALRVLTLKKPVTKNRAIAERDLDMNVLALHTERRTSELALEGDYTGSRAVALMNQRLGWRSSHSSTDDTKKRMYRQFFSRVQSVENQLSIKQKQEKELYGRTHSDEEEEEEEDTKELMDSAAMASPRPQASNLPSKPRPSLKKMMKRSEDVEDSMANILFQAGGCSSPAYKPLSKKRDPKK